MLRGSSVLTVPLSELRQGPNQARLTPHAPETIAELADAIAESDWVEALTVVRSARGFEVVAGAKRFAALRLLVARGALPAGARVPCQIVEAASADTVNAVENVHRSPLEPIALLLAIERETVSGRTQTQIAKLLGRNKSQISRYAGIRSRLQPDVWEAVRQRSFSLAELLELSWLPARRQRLRVGLDPLVGPPRPPPSAASRLRTRTVATVRRELRRLEKMPRSREQQIAIKTLNWCLSRRAELPI